MPPVPPMPRVRWGMRGSTPPMGMRQYSSSSVDFTVTPRCFKRTCKIQSEMQGEMHAQAQHSTPSQAQVRTQQCTGHSFFQAMLCSDR